MIQSFSCKNTESFYTSGTVPRKTSWQAIKKIAARKLDMLDAAIELEDLKVPPNNKLKSLSGNFKGFHSIRINDQWRIVFKWENGHANEVKICDYH